MTDYTDLKNAAEQATPGPWKAEYSDGDLHLRSAGGSSLMCDMAYYPWVPDEKDFIYIALANPATILTLLRRLEAAERVVEWVRVNPQHSSTIITTALATMIKAYEEAK